MPAYLPPMEPPFPRWYDDNAHCEYHSGNPEHSLEHCITLKYRVQELVQAGLLKFESLKSKELETSSQVPLRQA